MFFPLSPSNTNFFSVTLPLVILMMKKFQKNNLLSLFCLLLVLPTLVLADCTCDTKHGSNNSEVLKYKLIAIASILVAGAIGVCIPILGKAIPALHPNGNIFLIIKAFAGGAILATGFIHMLPDAFDNLTSPCLNKNPWGKFPFTGFVAMVAAICTLMVDSIATSYFNMSQLEKAQNRTNGDEEQDVEHEGHVHTHGSVETNSAESQVLRHKIISKVLELGIVVHSIIIGISLGASERPETIRPLIATLTFHQLFEGMGLGGCISQARESPLTTIIMVMFFSLTNPVGIGIGIGISNIYKENNPIALILEGLFNAASAGILIYMSLVDLLAADFMNPKMQKNIRLQIWATISLLFGAGCMSLLAKWA